MARRSVWSDSFKVPMRRVICWALEWWTWKYWTSPCNVASVKTYYCLWAAGSDDNVFVVEVTDPKDDLR